MLVRKLIGSIAAAGVIVALAGAPVFAEQAPPDWVVVGGERAIPVDDDELVDIAALADSLGISNDESLQRFAGQGEFLVAVDRLRIEYPSQFASAEWTPIAESRASVSFVGRPPADALALLNSLPYKVHVRFGARGSEAELERISATRAGAIPVLGVAVKVTP